MVSMRSLAYFIREALRNSRKNFSTALGAVVTIFLSLLVIGVFMALTLIINQLMEDVESTFSIEVFISDNALESDVSTLEDFMRAMPEVKDVVYVSKEAGLERLKEWAATSELADALDGNPIPAMFEVSLNDPEKVQDVVDRIKAHQSFLLVVDRPEDPDDSVKYGEDIIDMVIEVAKIIRYVCLGLVVLLLVVALIFINNTIRLAILARRKEIAIMRLVGASNGFIRGPFLMEGALQALIGAGLAIGTIALAYNYLSAPTQLSSMLQWLPDITSSLWMVYLILLGVGLVIGVFGSIWAMRRYLKV
jgi:cell division transport system permease protein